MPDKSMLGKQFLRGSYPPLVTPFIGGEVDHDGYAELVERQVHGGSHGIVVTGTTGEPSTLSVAERAALVDTAVVAAHGRLPVVAATGSQSLAETLELTAAAESAGADAVLVVTPYYIRPPQRGLVAYFTKVAKSTGLPLLIYHIPGRAAVDLTVDSVAAIADSSPNLVGMKHASPDLGYAGRLMRRLGGDFRLFVGLEELSLPLLAMGAAGLMNAVGNLAPGRVAALCEAVFAGDLAQARRVNDDLAELNEAVFWDTNPIPMKYLMKRMGLLAENEHRSPMAPATPELCGRLDDLLARTPFLTAADPAPSVLPTPSRVPTPSPVPTPSLRD
jgi:4-hydroxy-tetrahydrodipicolinate synthase